MKKFFRFLIWFFIPFVVILLPYLTTDPFKVLYAYEQYTPEYGKPMYINLNRGYVSTKMFLKNNPKNQYDSFIFGSSRSAVFRVDDWKKHLQEDASCFHFDGYGESLFLVYKKLEFLDRNGAKINNALICIDKQLIEQAKPFTTHLHLLPPDLVDGKGCVDFQMTYLNTYLKPKFLVAYTDFLISKKVKPYMKEWGIIDDAPYYFYERTNEVGVKDTTVWCDSTFYTRQRMEKFFDRPDYQTYYAPIIQQDQMELLQKIHAIFVKHQTNYKIIINPVYDQKMFDASDMLVLESIFGVHLYDFSGINEYTNSYCNYTDVSHFRQSVARDIMKGIYSKNAIHNNPEDDNKK